MRLKKIISGAEIGAERAALDTAILNNIPHGGWVTKGRKAKDDIVLHSYTVTESTASDYKKCAELNAKASDGTLIFTHGKLTDHLLWIQKYAHKHDKPCLHIDLNKTYRFTAANLIYKWMHEIEILNCGGSRASEDKEIYSAVFSILNLLLFTKTLQIDDAQDSRQEFDLKHCTVKTPETVEQAVQFLISTMSVKERLQFARISPPKELDDYFFSLALCIHPDLLTPESPLFKDCQREMGSILTEDSEAYVEAYNFILEKTWEKVKAEYRLRVVK